MNNINLLSKDWNKFGWAKIKFKERLFKMNIQNPNFSISNMNRAHFTLAAAAGALFLGQSSAFTFTTGAALGTSVALGTGSLAVAPSIGTGLALLGGVVLLKTAALAGLAIVGNQGIVTIAPIQTVPNLF